MVSFLSSLRFICSIWFITLSVFGRSAPYYDLDNDLYSELLQNVLQNSYNSKIPQQIPQEQSIPQLKEVYGWGSDLSLGEIGGVSVDPEGNAVIFHRGNRMWTTDSFNMTGHFQIDSPIEWPVVVTVDKLSGEEIYSWGEGMFYLPHGITVDFEGNVWLTDVALHQVFKFAPQSNSPSLVLGHKFHPGGDEKHFCKPTAIAVASSGDFFVADGYCNSRIMRFSPTGVFKGQFGHAGQSNVANEAAMGSLRLPSLNIPHGLTLNEEADILCIADRENGKIVCVSAGLRGERAFLPLAKIEGWKHTGKYRIFDVKFADNLLVGLAGSEEEGVAIGFTADLESEKVVDKWEPMLGFHNPHSLAVDQTTGAVYVAETGPNRVWKLVLPRSNDVLFK